MYDETASTGTRPRPSAEPIPDYPDPPATRPADTAPAAGPGPVPESDPRGTLGGMYVGPPLIREALRNSFKDGLLANGMQALLETFAIAAAVSLRASSMAIACMT